MGLVRRSHVAVVCWCSLGRCVRAVGASGVGGVALPGGAGGGGGGGGGRRWGGGGGGGGGWGGGEGEEGS